MPPPPPAAAVYVEPQAVVSVYVDAPVDEPTPVLVGWAPPPMLVDVPPPMPFVGAVWVGGYWAWQGRWVWAAGRWAPPPQPDLVWVHPYYENRGGAVVFVGGHWGAAGVAFVPPSPTLHLTLAVALPGVVAGPPCMGPQGVFVPAPPGSHPGLIVPAPIGTPPAVVTSAPPITNIGMRITNNYNRTNVTNVTNITNVTNVTIIAPASATASGRAYQSAMPAEAHIAAAMPPVVRATAPVPQSQRPIPAFVSGRAPVPLPPAQTVHPVVMQTTLHPAAAPQQRTAEPAVANPMTVAPQVQQAPQHPSAQLPQPKTQMDPAANAQVELAARQRQEQDREAHEKAMHDQARRDAASAEKAAEDQRAAKERAAKAKASHEKKGDTDHERRDNENQR